MIRFSAPMTDLHHQQERLLDLSSDLAKAMSVGDVEDAVAAHLLAASGAHAASLWAVAAGGAVATAVRAMGDEAVAPRHPTLPVEDWLALGAALLTGEPVWIESRREHAARFPRADATLALDLPDRELAFAVLPLIVEGRPTGALMLAFAGQHVFDEPERGFLVLLARHCAQALDRARQVQRTRALRERLEWLLALTDKLSLAATAREVAEITVTSSVEALGAASGALWFLDPGAAAARLVHHAAYTKALVAPARELPLDGMSAVAAALRSGEPQWYERRAAYGEAYADLAERTAAVMGAPVQSFACLPLVSHGIVLGALALSFAEARTFEDGERRLLWALAKQCATMVRKKRVEEQLREAAARAEEATRAKDEFLAMVGHELRNPLNAIASSSSLLALEASDPAAVAKAADVIRRSALAQARLVEDILDVSRIVLGKLQIAPSPVDLAAVARDAVEAVRPSAEAKGAALSLSTSHPSCMLVGDPQRLQQVVWNLLSNAVKFTRRGGRVTVIVEQEGPTVSLIVTDDGRGIAPDLLPRVFERFQQGEGTARLFGGLGLGLSIVRHLVEAHGGRVTAESEGEGKGATFRVELPVRAIAPPPRADEEQRSIAPPPRADEEQRSIAPPPRADEERRSIAPWLVPADIHGVRVLVVDDDRDAREAIREVLAGEGLAVETAASARQGLDALSRFRPDVIVSDIGMPVEDGYAFIRQVRARPGNEGGATPAIALTAYTGVEDRLRAVRAGFQRHVPKPVDARELLAVIASLHATRAT